MVVIHIDEQDNPWIAHADYLALKAALREALNEWENHADGLSTIFAPDLKRISALRAQFLDDKQEAA